MATNFPTSLDNFTNPTDTSALNSPSHSLQHADANDAIEAIEAKLGVGNSPAGSAVAGHVLTASTGGTTTWSSTVSAFTTLADGTTAMALATNINVQVTPTATATYTTTVPASGTEAKILILTTGATSRTITFGSGFRSTGTLATGTTTARYFMLSFISDGSVLVETSRTIAMA